MASTIDVRDANNVIQTIYANPGYEPVGDKLLVGTARERFFDNFNTWDTTNKWEVVSTGTGMTISGPLGGAVAGTAPYMNFNSGTTANQQIIIRSRSTFSMPVELRYVVTASARAATSIMKIGFLEVDDTGALVTDTTYSTAVGVLNARNAVMHSLDGTVATTSNLLVRVAGGGLDTFANAFGTGFTTVATGTTPNFIPATTYSIAMERDKVNARAWGQNVLTNTGAQFGYDKFLLDPTKNYKLYIIIENVGTPVSTDWRLHMVNVLDATRFDVSPRNPGNLDQSKSFPVVATIASGTITGVTTITTAGTPAVPATPYFVNSAATTNGALVLTGTSGVTAFWASNTGATAAFVKLYNKATAPTVGTDVPEMIIPVPAAVSGVPGVVELSPGFNAYRFALGLGIAITGGAADSDTTAVAAGQVKVKLSRTV